MELLTQKPLTAVQCDDLKLCGAREAEEGLDPGSLAYPFQPQKSMPLQLLHSENPAGPDLLWAFTFFINNSYDCKAMEPMSISSIMVKIWKIFSRFLIKM